LDAGADPPAIVYDLESSAPENRCNAVVRYGRVRPTQRKQEQQEIEDGQHLEIARSVHEVLQPKPVTHLIDE
jgi:hypothetical protein